MVIGGGGGGEEGAHSKQAKVRLELDAGILVHLLLPVPACV